LLLTLRSRLFARLTDLTLSCAAGLACRSRSGAPVAAIKLKQRDAICTRRDANALAMT